MPRYFELEISLQEIEPRIWRRLLLPTTASFLTLHKAIQESFGWQDYHLFEFKVPGRSNRCIAGIPSDEDFPRYVRPAGRVKLNDYFSGEYKAEWCEYVYDFGDDWVHDVKLCDLHSNKEKFKRRLLDGDRSAPPEDCGGTVGYRKIVEFLRTGSVVEFEDPEHLREWIGTWRPDAFQLDRAKRDFDR